MNPYQLLFFLLTAAPNILWGQCSGGDNTTQPSIMVVPVIPSSQDLLETIETNSHYREIIIAIDDLFKQKGFETKNFVQHLTNIRREEGINRYADSQAEIDAVVARAGPDIWIKTEIIIAQRSDKPAAKSLKLTAQAIHRLSATNMASKVFGSGRYSYVNDFGQRARKEIQQDMKFQAFLTDMEESFQKIRDEGISFSLSIICYQDAEVRLDAEVGDDFEELRDLISEYVRKKSYKSSPQANISSSTKLSWFEVKVPLKTEVNGDCVNYNIKKQFLNPLRKKIRSEWAAKTELKTIYPYLKNDGVGKWTITLCDSKDDCPRE